MSIKWEDYFLGLAFMAAQRSKDSQTKHGCIISDEFNIILGCGYNSFARGMPDKELPNTRPEKYPLIIHAEENALLNCNTNLRTCTPTAYVTGIPCFNCAYRLWQAGIGRVIYADRKDWSWCGSEEEKARFDILRKNLDLVPYRPDLSFISNVVEIAKLNNWA